MVLKIIFCLVLLCFISSTYSFHCYNCVEGVDDGCGDPFKATENNYLVDCDKPESRPKTADNEHRDEFDFREKKAKGCRKILQEIDDKTHVVRQCAYSGDDVNGMKRTGNKGVRLYYYQCSSADNCNGAENLRSNSFSLLALVFIFIIVFIFCR